MNKQNLSERDICTKFITPALVAAGWDVQLHVREEVSFTKGRIIVRGKMTARGESKRADYILYHKSGVALAIIEAKDNHCTVGAGMQQALGYAETLQIPFVFSSNGDAFLFHDRTLSVGEIEQELSLKAFPSPADLWARYTDASDIPTARLAAVEQPFHDDGSGKHPRYYQQIAVNRAVEGMPADKTACFSSWRRAPEKPTLPSKSSGGSGKPASRNASSSSPTETFW